MDFDEQLSSRITKLLRWENRGVAAFEFQDVYRYVKQDLRFWWVTRAALMMTLQCADAGDHYRFGVERTETYDQNGMLRKEFWVTQLPETVARHADIASRPLKRRRE